MCQQLHLKNYAVNLFSEDEKCQNNCDTFNFMKFFQEALWTGKKYWQWRSYYSISKDQWSRSIVSNGLLPCGQVHHVHNGWDHPNLSTHSCPIQSVINPEFHQIIIKLHKPFARWQDGKCLTGFWIIALNNLKLASVNNLWFFVWLRF